MKRWVLAACLLTGCQRCQSAPAGADAATGPTSFDLGMPEKVGAPGFAPLPSPQGYGLPTGCRFEGDVKRARLPEGRTRFVAAREHLEALALAHEKGAGVVEPGAVHEVPWGDLDAPPLLDRGSRSWIAAWAEPTAAGTRRALLWRGGKRSEALAEGDELALADVACRGDDCVVLGSLVRAAAAPGASWIAGKADAPASSWKRIDLDLGGDQPWRPLAIASPTWAALASDREVALFEVGADRAERRQRVDAPHGAYDATFAGEPLVIAPGDRTDRPCGAEEFPIVVLTASGKRHELRTPAPPESVIARPLAGGALVAWVAPVSCQHLERRVVYVTLLNRSGAPASSPMAVADATGFALATHGDALSLWLLSGRDLSWVRARCS